MTTIPTPDLRALIGGETVIAFVPRHTVDEGDELELDAGGPRQPEEVKAAYVRWNADPPPPGPWTGIVVALVPSAVLDAEAGSPRHVLDHVPDGDIAVLRVYGPDGPVLSDEAFAARRKSVEGAIEG
ncbi:MAG TPA: hypothetical protein VGC47_15080 [Acidimicrobiia bacterium]